MISAQIATLAHPVQRLQTKCRSVESDAPIDPGGDPAQAVLETTLRGYSCLTVGDAICVHYNNKKYFIDVIEARPANAIGVIDTDCQVQTP